MANQVTKTTKILLIVLGIVIVVGIIIVIVIPRMGSKNLSSQALPDTTIQIGQDANPAETESTIKSSQEEEYKKLIEDKNFVSVFNNFGYSGSMIEDAGLIEEDGSMFYIVMESKDNFGQVDNFYKSKKVQSIWSRSEIFETGSKQMEESFLNSENSSDDSSGDNNFSKYSYTSENKDKFLNILLRSYSADNTQIMIIYWQLSN